MWYPTIWQCQMDVLGRILTRFEPLCPRSARVMGRPNGAAVVRSGVNMGRLKSGKNQYLGTRSCSTIKNRYIT